MDLSDVSRETLDRLQIYESLTKKWTKGINLIAPSTIPDLWDRHIVDSAQIFNFIPKDARSIVDFGSGAGFPAMVLGILAAERCPETKVTCIESDGRKAVFLRTVAREAGVEVTVLNDRVETVNPLDADLVTARAFAALPLLLKAAERHRAPEGICLFPKGKSFEKELAAARKIWDFEHKAHPSQTEPGTVILEVGAFARV